jgi:hypothetical protein
MSLTMFIGSLSRSGSSAVEPPDDALTAGPDQTVDSGDTVQLAANKVGVWSTSGTGTFDDDTLPNAVYTPSTIDFLTNVTLTIVSGVETDSLDVEFLITSSWLIANITSINYYHDPDDAVLSAGNISTFSDKKGATITPVGTVQVVTDTDLGPTAKAMVFNGTSNGLTTAIKSFQSAYYVAKRDAGNRLHQVATSNTSTSHYAGVTFNGTTSRKNITKSNTSTRYEYSFDAGDTGSWKVYGYRNEKDYLENGVKIYQNTTSTNTTPTTTATNMQFGFAAEGDGGGAIWSSGVGFQGRFAACILASTEVTIDEHYLILKHLHQKYATLSVRTEYYEPYFGEEMAGNPILFGHPNGTGDPQFYSGNEMLHTNGITYAMGKTNPSSGVMASSADGISYSSISGVKISGVRSAYIFPKNLDTSLNEIWCFFTRRIGSQDDTITLYNCTNIATGGGTWANVQDVITLAGVNTNLGSSYLAITVTCAPFKIGSTYYVMLNAFFNTASLTNSDVVLCSSSDLLTWTAIRKILLTNVSPIGLFPPYSQHILGGDVALVNGRLCMPVTVGHNDSDTEGEKKQYLASVVVADINTANWEISRHTMLENSVIAGDWEQRRVYDWSWTYDYATDATGKTPVLVDNKYKALYSGHSLASATTEKNIGLYGVVYIDRRVFKTIQL